MRRRPASPCFVRVLPVPSGWRASQASPRLASSTSGIGYSPYRLAEQSAGNKENQNKENQVMRLRLGFLLVLMAALATAPTCLGMTSPQAVTLKDFPSDFSTFLTNPPAAVTSFLPTDAHVALAVAVSGQQLGDVISVDYVMPSGQVSSALSHAWSALTGDNIGLPYLMVLDMLQIAGQLPASTPGQWSAKFYYHPASSTTRTLLTTLTFTIGTTGGGGGGGSCTYILGATSASVVAGAVSGTVSVTAASGCSWTAVSNNTSWLTVYGGSSGSGNAYVTYMVTANSSTSSRTGTLTIAGQTFTVTQAGAFSGSNLTVNTIYLQGGSYSAGNFNVNAGYFSTAHGFFNYPLGVSAPSTSSPLLNASDWSINIPPGTYYLYLANQPATIGSAVMLTVMWSDGSQSDSIFTVGSLNGTGNWPLIQDSGFLSLGGTGITNANRVNTTGLSPDSSSNIVLTLTITAPGAGGGGGGGGSCSYTLGSASASLAASATTGTVSVAAASGCAWTAVSNNTSWLTVTSGASGSGNGTVGYSATANSGSSARTGTITIGGQTFTVSQAAAASCSYSLGAASASLAASAPTGTVSVTAASGCAWTAVSNNTSWLTVTSGASGSGNGTVNYSATANSGSSARTGTIAIGGQTFTVAQAAASACWYQLTPTSQSMGGAFWSGAVAVTAPVGCPWTAVSSTTWITVTSGGSGSGNGMFYYNVATNPDTTVRSGAITVMGQAFSIQQFGSNPTCNYMIGVPWASAPAGGTPGTVSVSAESGCTWTAVSNNTSWLTVTSGATGSGNGTVVYSVTANTSSSSRTGTITIAGQTFTVAQVGATGTDVVLAVDGGTFARTLGFNQGLPHVYFVNRLTPSSYPATLKNVQIYFGNRSNGLPVNNPITVVWAAASGGGNTLSGGAFTTLPATVTALGSFDTYTVSPMTIASGDFMVGFEVDNPAGIYPADVDTSSPSQQRSYYSTDGVTFGLLDAAGLAGNLAIRATVTLGSGSGAGGTCTASISPTSQTIAASGGSGSVSVTDGNGCTWTANSSDSWASIASGASGSGNGTVQYSVAANTGTSARTATLTIAGLAFTLTQSGTSGGGGGGGTSVNLVNGSFEQPGGNDILGATGTTITGWTVVAETNVDYIHSYFTCSDGAFCLDLDGTPGAGGIAQTFATTSGAAYTVTFDMAGNPGGGPSVKQMRVQAAGQSANFSFDITGHSANSMGWTTKTWTFTANSSSTTLEFDSLDGASSLYGPALDNVRVTAGSGSGGGGGGGANATGITLEGGAYASGTFSSNQQIWDTLSSSTHWVLGVSAPSVTSPLLNASDKSVNIPTGTYYLYSEPTSASFGTAARITVQWSGGGQDQAIFAPASLSTSGNWTRLSGSTNLSLASTGITNANRVSSTLSAGGDSDNVLQLTIAASSAGGGGGGCTYQLESPATTAMPASTTGSLAISTQTGCPWTAVSNASWITITSATSGTGTTIIFYKLDTNSGQDQRTGTISVGGQTYYVTQSGMSACSYVLSLNSATAPAGGTSNYLNLTTSVGCPYTVTSNASWITITSSATDVINGVVKYTVAPYTGTSPRAGTITIAGLTFTITQASICTYSISPTSASVAAAGGTGGVSVTVASGCSWTAAPNANWITIASGASGSGNGTVNYSVGANTATTARTGTATIATQTFTVTQAAAGGGGGGGTGANLLVNGSFEQPGGNDILSAAGSTITGWTVVAGTNVDYIHTYFTCSDGAFCLDLDGTPGAGGIAQTFATTPGTAYTVTFDMAGNPAAGPTVKQMRVQAAGQSASFSFDITGHSANSMGWTTKTWTFTANSSSTTLEFDSLDGPNSNYGPALDNVRVTAGSGSGGGGGGGANATGITLEGGAYASGTFSSNQQIWDTLSSSWHWVLGVSAPSVTSPMLNASDKSVNIPTGTYYLYSEPTSASFGTAARLTVQWSGGGQDQAIFAPASLSTSGNWTRLSGSTNLSLASTGITNANRVSSTLSAVGDSDNVLQLTIAASSVGGGGGGCTYQLESPATTAMPASTTGSLAISTQTGCPCTAVSNASWITITSATSGTGTTIIFYKLDTNSGQDQRTGTISVGGQTYYVTQSGMSACSYVLSLNSATAPAGGTSNYLNLTTSVGCPYTVTSNASWITITSSATDVINGVVKYTVAPYTGTSPRAGTITIAGLTFTITQASICTYSISPTSASVAAAGGTGGVSVTVASGCSWTAAANASWITIASGASGSGNGTVNYSVGANTATTARTGTATIATQTFTVTQAAAGGGGGGGTGANLLVNGSFEQPGGNDILSATGSTITGWTVVAGTNVDYIHTYFTCSDGAFCLDMDGTPGAGGIAQTFATTPGTAYTVTFDMAGNPAAGPTVKQMRVQAAGQSASFSFDITGHSANSMGWTTKTWTFTANSSSTTLEFDSLDGSNSNYGPALDNVRVTAGGGGGTCTFSINPTSQNVPSSGGSGSVTVTAASG